MFKVLVVVGSGFKARADITALKPEFEAPRNYGAEAAARFLESKETEWLMNVAATSPFTGTLYQPAMAFFAVGYQPILISGANVPELMDELEASVYTTLPMAAAEFEIFGAQSANFVKILAMEAAERHKPLPRNLWFGADARRFDTNSVFGDAAGSLKAAAYRLLPGDQSSQHIGSHSVAMTAQLLLAAGLYPVFEPMFSDVVKVIANGASFQPPATGKAAKVRQAVKKFTASVDSER